MPPDILIVYPMSSHMIFEESGDWPEGVHFRQFLSFYFRQLSDFSRFKFVFAITKNLLYLAYRSTLLPRLKFSIRSLVSSSRGSESRR